MPIAVSAKPRCVVIFASEDVSRVGNLVSALRKMGLDVWWAEDITQGAWEEEVRSQIKSCAALVPVVTEHTKNKPIFTDEWRLGAKAGRAIFPFVTSPESVPLGLGIFSQTDAQGWSGESGHPGIERLYRKIASHFGNDHSSRPSSISFGAELALPAFVYSLSSFETQLDPLDGLELLRNFSPLACLISAYDASAYVTKKSKKLQSALAGVKSAGSLTFLDSGNYEATRKNDYKRSKNRDGWCVERFWEVANGIDVDVVFSYDEPERAGAPASAVARILRRYISDWHGTGLSSDRLCPIAHVPANSSDIAKDAALILKEIAREIRPGLVAIPERELGDGLLTRMRSVKKIRASLNELGFYQPLHILGAGNPISIAALAACGADTFDGLEWCRTAANYENHNLFHFHQFDLLKASFASRITDEAARSVVEHDAMPFELRVASYNYDYLREWMGEVAHWVHLGKPEKVLKSIPHLGTGLAAELAR